jgi:hypothetical protein
MPTRSGRSYAPPDLLDNFIKLTTMNNQLSEDDFSRLEATIKLALATHTASLEGLVDDRLTVFKQDLEADRINDMAIRQLERGNDRNDIITFIQQQFQQVLLPPAPVPAAPTIAAPVPLLPTSSPSAILANLSPAVTTSPTTTALAPVFCKAEKMKWPQCPTNLDDFSLIQGWRAQFLSVVMGCDLAILYDATTRDLVFSHPDNTLSIRLGTQLTSCLPVDHPMVRNLIFAGRGLDLWHAFASTVQPQITFQRRNSLIHTFFHITQRKNTEDVYSYYNRLVTDAEYINFGTPGKHVSDEDFRQRFLFSLGPEFDFIQVDSVEGRLDPTLLTQPADQLQKRLQAILQTKKGLTTSLATSSTAGYACAATSKKEEQFETKPKSPSSTPLRERVPPKSPNPTPPRSRFAAPKYCFTHGCIGHTSMECSKPNNSHVKEATFYNRYGGSAKNCSKYE